ncbi:hypothetical protein AGR2A_pa80053 [Agrobacterium genomosp. 2 str. CFBP 5494]|uniref:Uncharacterized protein n=1 Tax=Agrobacterium genomosp. 2 str. CFBP 5494 TaxID=1183436 RepID=A0A9W5F615_9HYPH|nr:hypothetical protein AGR2A_pa80053 [Agrobacterium genomosp. 2 str. CFBP 5494]
MLAIVLTIYYLNSKMFEMIRRWVEAGI